MSGSKDILIEQLRAEVERLRDDRAELQERCNRLSAEKTEALRMLADAEDLANAANAIQTTDALKAAESEIDALRRQLASRTEAIQTSLATTRELRERAERAERERDEARADFRLVAEALGAMHEPCTGPSWPGTREEVMDVATRLRAERDEARAERDARPDVSAEDAAGWWDEDVYRAEGDAIRRVNAALRAHAAKVKP